MEGSGITETDNCVNVALTELPEPPLSRDQPAISVQSMSVKLGLSVLIRTETVDEVVEKRLQLMGVETVAPLPLNPGDSKVIPKDPGGAMVTNPVRLIWRFVGEKLDNVVKFELEKLGLNKSAPTSSLPLTVLVALL